MPSVGLSFARLTGDVCKLLQCAVHSTICMLLNKPTSGRARKTGERAGIICEETSSFSDCGRIGCSLVHKDYVPACQCQCRCRCKDASGGKENLTQVGVMPSSIPNIFSYTTCLVHLFQALHGITLQHRHNGGKTTGTPSP